MACLAAVWFWLTEAPIPRSHGDVPDEYSANRSVAAPPRRNYSRFAYVLQGFCACRRRRCPGGSSARSQAARCSSRFRGMAARTRRRPAERRVGVSPAPAGTRTSERVHAFRAADARDGFLPGTQRQAALDCIPRGGTQGAAKPLQPTKLTSGPDGRAVRIGPGRAMRLQGGKT